MCGVSAVVLQGLAVNTVKGIIDYKNTHCVSQPVCPQFPLNIKQFTILSLVKIQRTISYLFSQDFSPYLTGLCVVELRVKLLACCVCLVCVWVDITHVVDP